MELDLLPILDIMLKVILVLMPLLKDMIISHKGLEQETMLVSIPFAIRLWLVSFNNQVVMEAQCKNIEVNASMETRQKLTRHYLVVKLKSVKLKLLKLLDLKLMLLKQLRAKMLIKLNLAPKMLKLKHHKPLKLLSLKPKQPQLLMLQLMKPIL